MQRSRHGRRILRLLIFAFLLPLLNLSSGCGSRDDLSSPTEYQAVFLDNAQVFFGKLGAAGDHYQTLNDVFFFQRSEAEKKDVLMRMGDGQQAPNFLRINRQHIVIIQPVASDSNIAKLIQEAKASPSQGASTPPPAATPAPSLAQPPAAAPPGAAPPKDKKPTPK